MLELAINQSTTVVVPAIEPWYQTKVKLYKSNTYKMEVLPSTQVWRDGKTLGNFTANGKKLIGLFLLYPFIRMPLIKWFALLGCINKKRSTYFKIGTKLAAYQPPEDGELVCFANDALGFYKHNNTGQMVLTITRIS
jgi:hypothetical protein